MKMSVLRPWIDRSLPFVDELELAARAVLEGGREILKRYSSTPEVWSGPSGGPVTPADLASHKKVLEILQGNILQDRIISEENNFPLSDTRRSESDRVWLVDPLDGTKEFIAGNGEFSVMVGMANRQGAVLGAVYAPAWDRLYVGIVDTGAWVIERSTSSPVLRALSGLSTGLCEVPPRLRVMCSRSHPARALFQLTEIAGDVEWIPSGSVGLKCARIAEGEAHLYLHPVPFLREWDTCAPEAILKAAGGRVTDCRGMELVYGKNDSRQTYGIFAARPDIWSRLHPQVRKMMLPELLQSKD